MRAMFLRLGIILTLIGGAFIINANTVAHATVFQVNAAAYGFDISDTYVPFTDLDFYENEAIVYRNEKYEHYTLIVETFLQNTIDSTLYTYAYKVVTDPKQPGRNWGFLGIGSYGDDFLQDSVKTSIQFPPNYQIMSYAPHNSPGAYTTSIGVGAGSSGFDVSASVSFDHSELTVISNTSTGSRFYETIYDFDSNNNWTPYTTGEVTSYGMVRIKRVGQISFAVNHKIRYHDWNGHEHALGFVNFETGC